MSIREDLEQAIQGKCIVPYYEPIVRNITLECAALEALARWVDYDGRVLMPQDFIPIYEQEHLMYLIDLAILDQVLEDIRTSDAMGQPLPKVTVNLSRYDFEDCNIVDEILERVDAAGVDHKRIAVELTESIYAQDINRIKWDVKRLKKAGIEVWMDDFGSGYSSISLLVDFHFDMLKMDQTLIQNISDEQEPSIVVTLMTDMARQLKMGSLIEGVEHHEDFAAVREIGVEYLQGYWFGKPMPFEKLMQITSGPKPRLVLEKIHDSDYYHEIGSIDLHNPMNDGLINPAKKITSMLPAGIMQERNGKYTLLRCNWSMFEVLQLMEYLPEDVGDSTDIRFLREFPLEFRRTAAEAGDEWSQFQVSDTHLTGVHGYLRRLSETREGDAKAYLVIIVYAGQIDTQISKTADAV